MRYLPVFLDLQGRRVLVLGGGAVAARKAEPLARAGAEVVCAASFAPELLDGCALAVGADAAEADLLALAAAARARGIPVNIVDRPALCSFIMPAVVDRDPLTIAVSSAGIAPVLARLLRARIEAAVPPGFARLAALAETLRDEIRASLPDTAQRRRVLERLFTGRVAELVFAGEEAAARREALAEIAEAAAGTPRGMVFFLTAATREADLLSLRALRLLGEADVILHDGAIAPSVLETARRDAEREVAGPGLAGPLLVRLAGEGRKVVRLLAGPPPPPELEALAASLRPGLVVPPC